MSARPVRRRPTAAARRRRRKFWLSAVVAGFAGYAALQLLTSVLMAVGHGSCPA